MAGDDVTLKEHLSAVFDAKLANLATQIADLRAQNATDHAVVKSTLAEIKSTLAMRDERSERRAEKVDAEFDGIKKRIYTWTGGIGVLFVVASELVRHLWK